MRKTLAVLGVIAVLTFSVYLVVSYMSDQIITDNLSGDALVGAIQGKINYNSVSLIALIIGGIASLGLALGIFARYIARWEWTSRIP